MNPVSISSVIVAAALLAGCASSATPVYDQGFGEAVRQARALQTMNPDAGQNADPVAGVDGRAARAAMDRYHDSFKAPPRTFGVLGIGGSVGGGTGGQ